MEIFNVLTKVEKIASGAPDNLLDFRKCHKCIMDQNEVTEIETSINHYVSARISNMNLTSMQDKERYSALTMKQKN